MEEFWDRKESADKDIKGMAQVKSMARNSFCKTENWLSKNKNKKCECVWLDWKTLAKNDG